MSPTRPPRPIQTVDDNPASWTPDSLTLAGRNLLGFCPKCRVLRLVDLLALKVAGRGSHPVAKMRFRCERCGALGTPFVDWRGKQNERCSFDFGTGKKVGEW